jgi:hypothetical protein
MEKKIIDHFVITTYLQNGDVWETIRHTREGLSAVIQSIWQTDDVVRFCVEEKYSA